MGQEDLGLYDCIDARLVLLYIKCSWMAYILYVINDLHTRFFCNLSKLKVVTLAKLIQVAAMTLGIVFHNMWFPISGQPKFYSMSKKQYAISCVAQVYFLSELILFMIHMIIFMYLKDISPARQCFTN